MSGYNTNKTDKRDKDFDPKPQKTGFLAELGRNWVLVVLILAGAGYGAYMLRPPPPPPPLDGISQSLRIFEDPRSIRTLNMRTERGDSVTVSSYYGRPKLLFVYDLGCETCWSSMLTLDAVEPIIGQNVDILPVAIIQDATEGGRLVRRYYEERGLSNLRVMYAAQNDALSFNLTTAAPIIHIISADDELLAEALTAGDWRDEQTLQYLEELSGSG